MESIGGTFTIIAVIAIIVIGVGSIIYGSVTSNKRKPPRYTGGGSRPGTGGKTRPR